MTDDVSAMTPEERLAKDLCCECGVPLAGLDVPHHSMQHWAQFIRPDGTNAEAIRRQALMADYASSHQAKAQHEEKKPPPAKFAPVAGKD